MLQSFNGTTAAAIGGLAFTVVLMILIHILVPVKHAWYDD